MGLSALPGEIFTNALPDTENLKHYFAEISFPDIPIAMPENPRDVAIIKMASENCRMELYKKNRAMNIMEALEDLKKILRLPEVPHRIEGFDISHTAGTHTVASMVSFFNGKPDKAQYRTFHIKTLESGMIDDYQSMREVIARRYSRVQNDQLPEPDLILVDGGKGQLNVAVHILKALDMSHIPVAGLAEKNEEIFLPGEKDPIVLPRTSEALKILQNVRDESHRFANKFRTTLQTKDIREAAEAVPKYLEE